MATSTYRLDSFRIEIFLAVARHRSFARAAQELGLTNAAVSKQIAVLEEELGVKLLRRTTRHVSLTDEGAHYHDRVRPAIDELKEAAEAARDSKSLPRGLLKISAPLSFSQMHLLGMFCDFAAEYPDLTMDISLEDRKVDIIEEGFDIAIRIGVMTDSSLVAKVLADCAVLWVASPAYIDRHGMPDAPPDLARHRLISYALQGAATEWRYQDQTGKNGVFRGEVAFRANTAELMLQAALAGIGIARLPIFSVATDLRAGRLVQMLAAYPARPRPQIFALMPPNRYRTLKVQLCLDRLTRACKAMPWEPCLAVVGGK